jgi:hypothetical protein
VAATRLLASPLHLESSGQEANPTVEQTAECVAYLLSTLLTAGAQVPLYLHRKAMVLLLLSLLWMSQGQNLHLDPWLQRSLGSLAVDRSECGMSILAVLESTVFKLQRSSGIAKCSLCAAVLVCLEWVSNDFIGRITRKHVRLVMDGTQSRLYSVAHHSPLSGYQGLAGVEVWQKATEALFLIPLLLGHSAYLQFSVSAIVYLK